MAGVSPDEFPLVCGDCLGAVEYVRMLRAPADAQCMHCQTPFTVFRWRPRQAPGKGGRRGRGTAVGGREMRTVICQSCARLQNACQSCMRDFRFGLDAAQREAARKAAVGARNTAELAKLTEREQSETNQRFAHQRAEKELRDGSYAGPAPELTLEFIQQAEREQAESAAAAEAIRGGADRETAAAIGAAAVEDMIQHNTKDGAGVAPGRIGGPLSRPDGRGAASRRRLEHGASGAAASHGGDPEDDEDDDFFALPRLVTVPPTGPYPSLTRKGARSTAPSAAARGEANAAQTPAGAAAAATT